MSAVGAAARRGEAAASVEVGALHLAVADLITSDLSPKLTGIANRDQARSAELLTIALEFAGVVLKPGGAMIAKVFMGGETRRPQAQVRPRLRQGRGHPYQGEPSRIVGIVPRRARLPPGVMVEGAPG